jgi:cytochrome c oxidase subunit 2
MHVDRYERFWMIGSAAMIGLFIVTVSYGFITGTQHPPSHIETIDPQKVLTDPRFAEPGVAYRANGSVRVIAFAHMYSFHPAEIRVPAGRPITFRLTSPDVVHGFQIVSTNGNAMVVPGYITQFTTVFDRPGEYLIVCNEYCGLGHHVMQGKLIVTESEPASPR